MAHEDRLTTLRGAPPPSRRQLVIVSAGVASTFPLPEAGVVSIGRSRDNDLAVDDASLSRRHAILHIGEGYAVEDCGSANGTRVRGRALKPGTRVEVRAGEVVDLGSAMMIVQAAAAPAELRRIWPLGYFESRVEDECRRAERLGTPLAVAHLRCTSPEAEAWLLERLAVALDPDDVVGSYGPRAYEILVADASPKDAEDLGGQLSTPGVEIGLASCPEHGRTAGALFARARGLALAAAGAGSGPPIVVEDEAMVRLHHLVERIAASQISVLILGETGCGKEVIAAKLHERSERRDKPYLRLNCAGFSEALLESELFGHEKGAFTGADRAKPGLLETAQGGTVLLDEVGELPASVQAKLLRVLEERQIRRVGGLKSIAIDVRLVSATHRDLEREIELGRFRQDLYFRLNGICLVVPPLRDRPNEILSLARAFAARAGKPLRITPEAEQLLLAYDWPGNIRELRNVIERASLLSADGVIRPEQLPLEKMRVAPPATASAQVTEPVALSEMEQADCLRVLDALQRCAGNQTKAAELLGISRRTLTNRLNLYRLPRPRKARE
jgi:DNA-binding NtrC family response regulator